MTVPLPPAATSLTDFPRRTVTSHQVLCRIHLERRHPTYYGTEPTARFNPPPGVTNFGTCYVADGFDGAFAEVFGRDVRLLSSTDLQSRAWSTLQLQNDVDVADMTDRTILGRYGLTGEVSAGGVESYPRCQQWAAAVHAAGFAGVVYHARHDPDLRTTSYAVFGEPGEQDKPLIVTQSHTIELDDRLIDAARHWGFDVLPPTL